MGQKVTALFYLVRFVQVGLVHRTHKCQRPLRYSALSSKSGGIMLYAIENKKKPNPKHINHSGDCARTTVDFPP